MSLELEKMKLVYKERINMEKLNINKIRIESERQQKTMDVEKDVKLGEIKKTLIKKHTNSQGNIKLPKLELTKFDGNIFKW